MDYGESELMIDEIDTDEGKLDVSENNQISMLSADDAARLTEMLVSAQNNAPQDLVLTGSIRFVYCLYRYRKIAVISAIYWDRAGPTDRLLRLRVRSPQTARAPAERQSHRGTSSTPQKGIKSIKRLQVRVNGFANSGTQ